MTEAATTSGPVHAAPAPPPAAGDPRTPRPARIAPVTGPATAVRPVPAEAMEPGVEARLSGACFGYATRQGASAVLRDIDLELGRGERVAVVGASGCGKSTLLHALAGLLGPTSGSVGLRGRAAYMFQNDLLLPWKTVLANATFAAECARERSSRERSPRGWSLREWSLREWSWRAGSGRSREIAARAEALLREFGLGDALHLHPHELSGGMRQRVALARTLCLGRELVLLDEPFASVDALTRADLRGWLGGVMEAHPAAWVLVTHDVDEAVELAERVVVLGGKPATILGVVEVSGGGGPALREGDGSRPTGEAGLDRPTAPAGHDRPAWEVAAPDGADRPAGGGLRRAAASVRDLLEGGRM